MTNGSHLIVFRNVYKVFTSGGGAAAMLALRDINLEVSRGEFLTIVGPSGCGKSTLLNMVAGIVQPSHGEMTFEGRPVEEARAQIGYVAQEDYLLPWRDLLHNVTLGLEYRGVAPAAARAQALTILAQVGLSGFEGHYPSQLSGGMKKRASIARTLVCDPSLILMDEPFGPLDAQTRTLLQDELLRLWQDSGKTILFITHDLVESIALSDRIVVLARPPGMIKSIHEVRLPRPRNVFKIHDYPEFSRLYQTLWQEIQEELADRGNAR
jgi:NitT/TauT family transport system ATP-binding protein